MLSTRRSDIAICIVTLILFSPVATANERQGAPDTWAGDLQSIEATDWNSERAAHLLERAGFGGTPEDIARFAAMTPRQAVNHLVRAKGIRNDLPAFEHSGVHDPAIEPFPVSRPATTDLAKAQGEALGIKVKPDGNRRMQAVVNKFFYWLRASRLETNRVAYWWANRMVATQRPLEEKMALFWHGHFATSENKVRDYRKMLQQFQQKGLGNFRDVVVGVAQDPAMLTFLDAGVNVKGAPNENFAREIMELFTMGVGNYSESDIREVARAFTGWNNVDTKFVVNRDRHDDGEKTVLGQRGRFDGVQAIDIILQQPVTAEFVAGKVYRFFVREELTPELQKKLGALLRDGRYEIAPLLETIFLSRDFYSPAAMGTRIKSPVELAVSTYRKLGLKEVPGVPDFNDVTTALGQNLLRPPTVAGWAYGRSWITPGLLMERANYIRDILFPDITFIPSDRYPVAGNGEVRAVHERISQGMDISKATIPDGKDMGDGDMMAMSNKLADRDEDFNTRYGSYRGWQKAVEMVKPIPRHTARLDLAGMVKARGLKTTAEAVAYFAKRFLRVPLPATSQAGLVAFLNKELGTASLREAETYMEDGLRMMLHLMLSSPEYQLG
jgi:uncharacterized protein (DUF1800 family)